MQLTRSGGTSRAGGARSRPCAELCRVQRPWPRPPGGGSTGCVERSARDRARAAGAARARPVPLHVRDEAATRARPSRGRRARRAAHPPARRRRPHLGGDCVRRTRARFRRDGRRPRGGGRRSCGARLRTQRARGRALPDRVRRARPPRATAGVAPRRSTPCSPTPVHAPRCAPFLSRAAEASAGPDDVFLCFGSRRPDAAYLLQRAIGRQASRSGSSPATSTATSGRASSAGRATSTT